MNAGGPSRTEQLNTVLRQLQTESPDVTASALISDDGLMIASALPQHVEEVRIAGMSATIHSLGSRAAAELKLGEVEQILIRGQDAYAVMLKATEGTMLLCLTSSNAKLGLIFLDMTQAVRKIRTII